MIKKIFLSLFFLLLLGLGISLMLYKQISYTSQDPIALTILPGSSLKSIAHQLEQKHVISEALLFEALLRLSQKGHLLKAGDYEFEKGLTLFEVIDILIEGHVKLETLTIPEGYNLNQIGDLLVEKKLISPNERKSLLNDQELLALTKTNTSSLEGYLFPDTYLLDKQTRGKVLIKKMIELFYGKVTPELIAKAQSQGFGLNEWVTLASIIEKETGLAKERPLIARVFLNRLSLGMLLQTDPTVIYGIGNFDGNLTRAHLERDTPYNTYIRPGLPPTPICSPGLESLMAVLNPAEGDFVYFVAKGDGSHHFSKTLEEHNRAVNYYQRKIGSPP